MRTKPCSGETLASKIEANARTQVTAVPPETRVVTEGASIRADGFALGLARAVHGAVFLRRAAVMGAALDEVVKAPVCMPCNRRVASALRGEIRLC